MGDLARIHEDKYPEPESDKSALAGANEGDHDAEPVRRIGRELPVLRGAVDEVGEVGADEKPKASRPTSRMEEINAVRKMIASARAAQNRRPSA